MAKPAVSQRNFKFSKLSLLRVKCSMTSLRIIACILLIIVMCNNVRGVTVKSSNQKLEDKKTFIKQMMKEAWDTYETHAWGEHSVDAHTQRPDYHGGVPGRSKCGATITASLDTLHIMGLHEEFRRAKDWVEKSLNFSAVEAVVEQSEIIWTISGLLSAYFMTNDRIFLQRAQELGAIDLQSFRGRNNGLPYSSVNLANPRRTRRHRIDYMSTFTMAELAAKFWSLSNLTGDRMFMEKADGVRAKLLEYQRDGIFPDSNHFPLLRYTTDQTQLISTFLNQWLVYGNEDSRRTYDFATNALLRDGYITRAHRSQLIYLTSKDMAMIRRDMMLRSCMSAGLFALGAISKPGPKDHEPDNSTDNSTDWFLLGQEIAATCFLASNNTATRLVPGQFKPNWPDGSPIAGSRESNHLEPYLAYSFFILHRLTGDSKYRGWGWEMAKAIKTSARDPRGGYGGVIDVTSLSSGLTGSQPPNFLGGTLKFLYLLFCDSDYYSLHDWVYDLDGHLMPVTGGSRLGIRKSKSGMVSGKSSGSTFVFYLAILIVVCVGIAFSWKYYWPKVKAARLSSYAGMTKTVNDDDADED